MSVSDLNLHRILKMQKVYAKTVTGKTIILDIEPLNNSTVNVKFKVEEENDGISEDRSKMAACMILVDGTTVTLKTQEPDEIESFSYNSPDNQVDMTDAPCTLDLESKYILKIRQKETIIEASEIL